jgi:hypothetical protein
MSDGSGSREIWVARAFRAVLCVWAGWDQPARVPAIAPTLQLFHQARKLGVAVRVHHTCRPNRNVSQRSETLRRPGTVATPGSTIVPDGTHFATAVDVKAPIGVKIEQAG